MLSTPTSRRDALAVLRERINAKIEVASTSGIASYSVSSVQPASVHRFCAPKYHLGVVHIIASSWHTSEAGLFRAPRRSPCTVHQDALAASTDVRSRTQPWGFEPFAGLLSIAGR